MEKIVIFGIGEIAEMAWYYFGQTDSQQIVAFTADREYCLNNDFKGLPLIPFDEITTHFSPTEYKMFIAVGYTKVNKIRTEKYKLAKTMGYSLTSYISPNATIANNVSIGDNCFVFEDNTLQPFTKIGNNCVLWSGNHIGHHSLLEDNCFITSHVVVSGGCVIGESTFIGVNATLRDHIKIGKSNVIGAGALILGDTEDNKVYMATPTEPSKVPSNRLRGI
ncbi:MAG: acetyltransferase [Campylobacterota bacterium]